MHTIRLSLFKVFPNILLSVCICCGSQKVHAQQGSGDLVTQFTQIATGYQKPRMYVAMRMESSTTWVTDSSDISSISAEFFVQPNESSMRQGAVWQVVSNRVTLLVDSSRKRIIVFEQRDASGQAARGVSNALSAKKLLLTKEKYVGIERVEDKLTSCIRLKSVINAFHSDLPEESLSMTYAKDSGIPKVVTSVKRQWISVSAQVYEKLSGDPNWKGKLLKQNELYLLMKETTSNWIFDKVEYKQDVKSPYPISRWVIKNNTGGYDKAPAYADYELKLY